MLPKLSSCDGEGPTVVASLNHVQGWNSGPENPAVERFRAVPALDLTHIVFGAERTHTDRVRVERTAEPDLFSAAGGVMRAFIYRLVRKHSKNLQEFPFAFVENMSIASSPFK